MWFCVETPFNTIWRDGIYGVFLQRNRREAIAVLLETWLFGVLHRNPVQSLPSFAGFCYYMAFPLTSVAAIDREEVPSIPIGRM